MINAIFMISLILLVWFKTDAFNEYCKLFNLNEKFYLNEYNQMLLDGAFISYPDFLAEYHPSFFTKLISCPICLSVWLGIFFSIFIGLFSLGTLSFLGLLFYKLMDKIF